MLPMMYGFCGLLVAQLLSSNLVGFYFLEAGIFAPNNGALRPRLQSAEHFTPPMLQGAS